MNRTDALYQSFLEILREELVPAMGCTEPIAIAYAAAQARAVLGKRPERVRIEVSGNIIKNVKSVIVPHTGSMHGIAAAAAAGIIAGGICKYAGARRVVITDVNEYRLALARKMGVDAAVNTANEDLHAVMRAQGLTEGFDVGLEMSGNAAAFHQMISVMRSGGKISLLGLGDGPISVDMNQIITNGLTLQGIYGRKMDNWHQMSYMVQGGLDLTPVITHRFHYTDFQKGFDAMMSGKSGKVVLDWTK